MSKAFTRENMKVQAEAAKAENAKRKVREVREEPKVEMDTQVKFGIFRKELCASLVEREPEVDLTLTALVCQEHILLVGAPGLGKSQLLDNLLLGFDRSVRKFPYLLTKFTDPAEIFGPVNIEKLCKGSNERITDGLAAESEVLFLDECFKASSAILNCMLNLLNERVFRYGRQQFSTPLMLAMGASNEWPQGQELGALWDRFLFRKEVKPVSQGAGVKALLQRAVANDPCRPTYTVQLTVEDVIKAHKESKELPWSDQAKKAMWEILVKLQQEGIVVSDRRKVKSIKAARAAAYLAGADEVRPEHLEVLAHVLWEDPQEQPQKAAKVVMRIANPTAALATEKMVQAEDVMAKEKDNPTEANAKLKLIIRDLREMLANGDPSGRVAQAIAYVEEVIKRNYDKVLGRE